MKILLSNEWLVTTGGTGTFTYTMAGELTKRGHDVFIYTNDWGGLADKICNDFGAKPFIKQKYDLIIANHITTVQKVHKFGLTIQTCHGIFPTLEQPSKYADGHVAISKEVQKHLILKGFPSLIIHNPIDCTRFKPTQPLKKDKLCILSLCHSNEAHSIIKQAAIELGYSFKYLDKRKNWIWEVEKAINESDLIVGLGRSIYEALACGRPVIIYDNRHYYKNVGDGYFSDIFFKSLENNCSGRAFQKNFTIEDLKQEIKKYNPKDGIFARNLALNFFNVETAVDQYLEYKKILEHKKEYNRFINITKRTIFNITVKRVKYIPKTIRQIGKKWLINDNAVDKKQF